MVALWFTLLRPAVQMHASPVELAVLSVQAAVLLLLIPISLIDLDHMIIPDAFTLPGIVVAFGFSWLPGGLTPVQSLIGLLAGGGILLFFGKVGEILFKKGEGMGGGDVKLMAWAGALWGWQTALLAVFFASFVGALVGVALLALRSLARDHRIPFGPFLAAGLWVAVLFGDAIVRWYWGLSERMIL